MELSVDAVKILSTKLDPKSLSSLRCISKTVMYTVDTALSDNLTYKLMTEELLGMSLPDYRTVWKNVYNSFVREPNRPLFMRNITWNSMSPVEQRLYSALYSYNIVAVEIALYKGQVPDGKVNGPLYKALERGNTEIARLLLSDERVLNSVVPRTLLKVFYSGKIDTIKLVLEHPLFALLSEYEDDILRNTIISGSVKSLTHVVGKLGLSLALKLVMPSALNSQNSEMILYSLSRKEVPYTSANFLEDLSDVALDDDILESMLRHPRIARIVMKHKREVLKRLIANEKTSSALDLLTDPNFDVSQHSYSLVVEAIEYGDDEVLHAMLSRPEVNPDREIVYKMLNIIQADSTLDLLLKSNNIVLDEGLSQSTILEYIKMQPDLLYDLLSHEKVVVNKDIVKKAMHQAMQSGVHRDSRKILQTHPRTNTFAQAK